MSQPCPFNTRIPIALGLLCSGMFLTGSAAAAFPPADPVEIMFETTSPYYNLKLRSRQQASPFGRSMQRALSIASAMTAV